MATAKATTATTAAKRKKKKPILKRAVKGMETMNCEFDKIIENAVEHVQGFREKD